MSEPHDIQHLLQTGYFRTSRSREPSRSSYQDGEQTRRHNIPSASYKQQTHRSARPPKHRSPPAPTVEDEEISLAKEYDAGRVLSGGQDEIPCRGELEQQPIFIEVAEFNPERRFVILNNAQDHGSRTNDGNESLYSERKRPPRPLSSSGIPGQVEVGVGQARSGHQGDPGTGVRHDGEPPRAWKDLPHLEIGNTADHPSKHIRTRSAANGPRPDFFSPSESRPFGETLLSPEMIPDGAMGRRERVYPETSSIQSKIEQNKPERPDMRRNYTEDPRSNMPRVRRRRDSIPSPVRGSTVSGDSSRIERAPSRNTSPESRTHRDYPSSKPNRRDGSRPLPPENSERPSAAVPRRVAQSGVAPDDSRSGDEHSSGSKTPERRAKGAWRPERRGERDADELSDRSSHSRNHSRNHSRTPSSSTPVTNLSGNAIGSSTPLRQATGAQADAPSAKVKQTAKPTLPYPDDEDAFAMPLAGDRNGKSATAKSVNASRGSDQAPLLTPNQVPLQATAGGSSGTSAAPSTKPGVTWNPGNFNPETDKLPVDKNQDTIRRYSEIVDGDGKLPIPVCQRKKAVAGKRDWLTIPNTDYNVCPDCYGAAFGETQFRTHLQPMLRPTDNPIACDFGLSPWFRIAWLLSLKSQMEDLRVFQRLSKTVNSSRSEPCPGDRKVTGYWLRAIDPRTRQPVPNFLSCERCADTVEIVFPNLKGLFVPYNRTELTRGTCALHFTPDRRQFVTYVDTLEETSFSAFIANQKPNMVELASDLEKISLATECKQDDRITDGYWHTMQYIPQFTVCAKCFVEVVRPRIGDDNLVARNFYRKPEKIPMATCQLYSKRMRDIFKKSCRYNDFRYLEDKVNERLEVEADIRAKLLKLDRRRKDDSRTAEQVGKLIRDWNRWE